MPSVPRHLLIVPTRPKISLGKIQIKSREQMEQYLSHYSVEELRQAGELWKQYAGHKTLIDFAANEKKVIHLAQHEHEDKMTISGWIGVDLDGTLAHYDGWKGADYIGDPVLKMVERVKKWLADGVTVKIFTARVSLDEIAESQAKLIQDWCEKHIGARLDVTCKKDFSMIELWDDRAIQVQINTGERI